MKFMCTFLGHRWHSIGPCQLYCLRCGALLRSDLCLSAHPQHGDPYP